MPPLASDYLGVLTLKAKTAAQLNDTDTFSKADPYLVCSLRSEDSFVPPAVTNVVSDSVSPVWDQVLTLNVTVRKTRNDDFLGKLGCC